MRKMFSLTLISLSFIALCSATELSAPLGNIKGLDAYELYHNGWKLFLQQTNQYKNWCNVTQPTQSCATGSVLLGDTKCRENYFDIMALMVTHMSSPDQLETIHATLVSNPDFCNQTVLNSGASVTRFGNHSKELTIDEWIIYWRPQRYYYNWCEKTKHTTKCVKADKKVDKDNKPCLDASFPLVMRMELYNYNVGVKMGTEMMITDIPKFCSHPKLVCTAGTTTPTKPPFTDTTETTAISLNDTTTTTPKSTTDYDVPLTTTPTPGPVPAVPLTTTSTTVPPTSTETTPNITAHSNNSTGSRSILSTAAALNNKNCESILWFSVFGNAMFVVLFVILCVWLLLRKYRNTLFNA